MTLRQAVVFAILMEKNQGIVGKSPSYIQEKLTLCGLCETEDQLLSLLDFPNQLKYRTYKEMWIKKRREDGHKNRSHE